MTATVFLFPLYNYQATDQCAKDTHTHTHTLSWKDSPVPASATSPLLRNALACSLVECGARWSEVLRVDSGTSMPTFTSPDNMFTLFSGRMCIAHNRKGRKPKGMGVTLLQICGKFPVALKQRLTKFKHEVSSRNLAGHLDTVAGWMWLSRCLQMEMFTCSSWNQN